MSHDNLRDKLTVSTVREAARRAGISEGYMHQILSGDRIPGRKTILKIVAADIGITSNDLLKAYTSLSVAHVLDPAI